MQFQQQCLLRELNFLNSLSLSLAFFLSNSLSATAVSSDKLLKKISLNMLIHLGKGYTIEVTKDKHLVFVYSLIKETCIKD